MHQSNLEIRRRALILALASVVICLAPFTMLFASEPFGAEDKGSESHVPSIPEPMVFDLVRSLGAKKGEFEANVLAEFPLGDRPSSTTGFDPFGLAPASEDRAGTEWAPEIEWAVMDGFAIEFEVPFEDRHLEAYKFAAQWTFGTHFNDQFIDGAQIIIEPDVDFEVWDIAILYIAGIQIDQRWSALGMIGVRPEIEEGNGIEHVDGILNFTLFRDLNHWTTVGLESNFTFGDNDRTTFLLVPQIDVELTDNLQVQTGIGVGFSPGETQTICAVRAIYSR